MTGFNSYYATSKDTVKKEQVTKQFYLEFNPNLDGGMYRINSDQGVPKELMGYNPHRKALISKIHSYVKRH